MSDSQSSGTLSQRQLLDIAREQNVDVPIMSYRVTGDRVELFLYGGQVISAPADLPQFASVLENFSTTKLRKIAKDLNIPGRTKMNKDELVEAILSAPS
jgi:hypothetical protein